MILFALLQRLFALASLAILGTGAWLLWSWWERERLAERLDLAEPTDERLYWALVLLALSFLGRFVVLALLGRPGPSIDAGPHGGTQIAGPDGTRLHVRTTGRPDGPMLLFTHGWGMSARIWGQAERALADRFGFVVWDLPGSGRSTRTKAWSIETFADDLRAVLESLPKDRPVVLIGHSIGGMTAQTFCARHGAMLDKRVVGLVLENTTHLNPLRTMVFGGLLSALEPFIRLIMRVDTVLSPLLWVMNWQSYLSGATHLAMRITGYGSRPSWSALDLSSLLPTRTSPAVQARGNLAMFNWSVTERLPSVRIPSLVFVGERDVVTRKHAGERIADLLPNARLARMSRSGHMGPFEQADAYHQTLAEFAEAAAARRDRYDVGVTSINQARVVQS